MGKARDLNLNENYFLEKLQPALGQEIRREDLRSFYQQVEYIEKQDRPWMDYEDHNPEYWISKDEWMVFSIAIRKIMDGDLTAEGYLKSEIHQNMINFKG